MGIITAIAGFLFACLVGGLLGAGLFLEPVAPLFEFVTNYGLYVLILFVIWAFFLLVSACILIAGGHDMPSNATTKELAGTCVILVLTSVVPQLIGWWLINAFVGQGSDSLGVKNLNNRSLFTMCVASVVYALLVFLYNLAVGKLHAHNERVKAENEARRKAAIRAKAAKRPATTTAATVTTPATDSTTMMKEKAEPDPEEENPTPVPQALNHMCSIS